MKKIEISDEMHAKLIELATEMTTQDMRITPMPHMFQIQTQKRFYNNDMSLENRIWKDEDYNDIEGKDELLYYMRQVGMEAPENFDEMWDDFDDYLTDELTDWIKDSYMKLHECSYEYSYEYQNTFFTAKACKHHIKENDYRYNDPTVYLNHAFRNPEMELVSEFLCNLVGKNNHK